MTLVWCQACLLVAEIQKRLMPPQTGVRKRVQVQVVSLEFVGTGSNGPQDLIEEWRSSGQTNSQLSQEPIVDRMQFPYASVALEELWNLSTTSERRDRCTVGSQRTYETEYLTTSYAWAHGIEWSLVGTFCIKRRWATLEVRENWKIILEKGLITGVYYIGGLRAK